MRPVQMPLLAIQPVWKHQAEEGDVSLLIIHKGFTDL